MTEEQATVVDQQSEQTATETQTDTQPQSFVSSLPEDLQGEASLQSFQDVGQLAKSYVHSQRMIGQDKIAIPGKNATEEDWKQVYQKLGVPESADKYDVKYTVQEGASDQPVKDFLGHAHKMGLLPHQAQGILDYYTQLETTGREEINKQNALSLQNSQEQLRKDFGLAYDKEVSKANTMFNKFFQNELKDVTLADGSNILNHPGFVKSLAKLSNSFTEDNISGGQDEGGAMTPDQAEKEINKILADPNGPYWNKKHPNHESAVKEVFQLQNMKLGIESE
jgi:hypothetical protein